MSNHFSNNSFYTKILVECNFSHLGLIIECRDLGVQLRHGISVCSIFPIFMYANQVIMHPNFISQDKVNSR